MGHRSIYFRNEKRTLKVVEQATRLRCRFPESHVELNKNISMIWVGSLHPSPLSEIYTVKISYKLRKRPQVNIIKPELAPRNRMPIPHLFPGKELCLFRYKYFEWDSSMSIADTILPWTSLWLLHYEIWHATGVWSGSKAEHPSDNRPKEPEQAIDVDKNDS